MSAYDQWNFRFQTTLDVCDGPAALHASLQEMFKGNDEAWKAWQRAEVGFGGSGCEPGKRGRGQRWVSGGSVFEPGRH